jgi:hypothetical protein
MPATAPVIAIVEMLIVPKFHSPAELVLTYSTVLCSTSSSGHYPVVISRYDVDRKAIAQSGAFFMLELHRLYTPRPYWPLAEGHSTQNATVVYHACASFRARILRIDAPPLIRGPPHRHRAVVSLAPYIMPS